MKNYSYKEIQEGTKKSREYEISADVYAHFMDAFKDTNPLHIDDGYARAHGFTGRVAHGAILNGFISHFVGVEFPGKNSLLQSVQIQYKAPNYIGDTIALEAKVTQKVDALKVVVLTIHILNRTQNTTSAQATVQVGMLENGK